MKYSIHRITEGEDELILNYRELTPEVERILQFMNRGQTRLPGRVGGETVLFAPDEVLYIETVDDKTFAYTKEKVIRLDMTLSGCGRAAEGHFLFPVQQIHDRQHRQGGEAKKPAVQPHRCHDAKRRTHCNFQNLCIGISEAFA